MPVDRGSTTASIAAAAIAASTAFPPLSHVAIAASTADGWLVDTILGELFVINPPIERALPCPRHSFLCFIFAGVEPRDAWQKTSSDLVTDGPRKRGEILGPDSELSVFPDQDDAVAGCCFDAGDVNGREVHRDPTRRLAQATPDQNRRPATQTPRIAISVADRNDCDAAIMISEITQPIAQALSRIQVKHTKDPGFEPQDRRRKVENLISTGRETKVAPPSLTTSNEAPGNLSAPALFDA